MLIAVGRPAEAPDGIQLDGAFVQGGLVQGRTEPGTALRLGERVVRVSGDGHFVIGFGREAPTSVELFATYTDGRTERLTFEVAARDYAVQRIDGLPSKMVTPPEAVLARIREEAARIEAVRANDGPDPLYLSGFQWPALGRISGVYGSQRILNGQPRQPHYGIDIAAPEGTVVVAPADGVVSLVEEDLYYTGGTIILDHGHGLTSAFLHMQEMSVAVGQRVRQGERIGTVGSTGRSTGPHLDWRVNWFEERLDPALLAGPMPSAEKAPAPVPQAKP